MKKLTLVVGAGASQEVGLPVGSGLKNEIAQHLDIRFPNGITQTSGSFTICEAFRIEVKALGEKDINPYLHACWRIRDSMPQAISIDNFIDINSGDSRVELAGKLGIALSILEAERKSSIYIDSQSGNRRFPFSETENTWLNRFFKIVTENCPWDLLPARLREVCLVVFNYDRCIEHYLVHAFMNYYGKGVNEVVQIMQELDVIHPYGEVGRLELLGKQTGVEFGEEVYPDRLLDTAKDLKTFTEGTDEKSSDILKIREAVSNTSCLAFIGFSFHRLNMNLLSPKPEQKISNFSRCVVATALGVSGYDSQVIRREISDMINLPIDAIHINNKLKCVDLFGEFSRSLSLS